MARYAPPAPVVVDILELGELGDRRVIPKPHSTPWADGDAPLWESVDLTELPNEVLKMKVCRSFRADLRHKVIMIIRAHGGYGRGGVKRACRSLRVRRMTLYRWMEWKHVPKARNVYERIDTAYEEAIQTLVAQEMKRRDTVERAKTAKAGRGSSK